MENYAHELFLLSTNLTQFKSKVLITKIFVESINSIFPGHKFIWSEEIVENEEKCLKVCTRSKTYAYISFSKQPTFTEETFSLLQNTVQWLAILFEKLEQETLLNNQKEHLNSLVEEKTKDLVESQEQLKETSKMAMVGGWQIDFYGNTLNWTSETYRIHELSEERVPNVTDAIQFYHPDDQQMVGDCVQKSIETGESFDFEARLITAKGNEKWVRAYGKIVSNEGESIGIHGMIQDITERKIRERELLIAKEQAEESQMQLELITDNFVNGMIYQVAMLDENRRQFNYISNNVKKLYGCTVKEAKEDANLIYGKLHPDDVMGLIEKEKEALKNMSVFETESRVITSNGNIRWAYYISKPRIINGVVCWDGIEVDITERKQMELELIKAKEKAEESEEILKTTLQTAMDGYWVVDIKGRFLNVNDTYCRMSGYNRKDLLSMHIGDVEAIQSSEEIIKNIQRIIQLGQLRFETKHIRKDGTLYDVEMGIQHQETNDGQFVCFIKDITEQKKHEAELLLAKEKAEESEIQLQYSQKVARIGYYIFNIQTGLWTSSEMLDEIFGINKNYNRDVQGWLNLIHPDFQQEMSNYLSVNILKNHETFNKSYQITNIKTGLPYWVHGLGTLEFDNDGNLLKMFGTIQDISDSKKFEQEIIKAKEKAEESDRLKSAFLANMSHEIRTPMNGILGFTSLLRDANLSVKNQKDYINIIEKSGDRLLNTVNDIIEISKIESGDINVIKSKVDIIDYLDTLVTFFKPEAEKKNIDIIVQNSIDENDLTITTDKNKLSSILSNLIKNAIKYTDEGTINVGLKVENNQILFTCQDTGIGIPKSRLEAIFNRFEQADIEDKHALQGSGLGLAIVKSYVELLDGRIWVESEKEKGSVFYVSLPYEHEKKKEQIVPKEVKSFDFGMKNIKVLIVEDDDISSMHLYALLKGKVKNIISVKNGIEAIDACKNDSKIDLILMDFKMPKMGGIEATKQIREFNKNVIIVAQTAYALEGDKEKAIDAGCNDYISKPINKDKLFELINKYF